MDSRDQEFVEALQQRVQVALREAQQVVARSRTLTSVRHVLGDDQRLVRRCAWCGRFSLGEGWMAEAALPQFVPGRAIEGATHTICPDCDTRLVREGKSHSRNGD